MVGFVRVVVQFLTERRSGFIIRELSIRNMYAIPGDAGVN